MKALYILAIFNFIIGTSLLFVAESSIHEIISSIYYVIGAIFFTGGAIIEFMIKNKGK